MITFLQEKTSVAAVLGQIDGGTANTIRDNAINEARQFDIANAYPFSWLETSVTLTTSSSGSVDLPVNFNITHKPKDIYSGTKHYGQVSRDVFDRFGSGQFGYHIDYNTTTDKWRINTTENSTSITIIYYIIPTLLSADTDIDFIPDITVIKYLAAARFWLTERNYGNHDRFNDLGQNRLRLLMNKDKKSKPRRLNRGGMYHSDLGWNVGG